MDWNFVCTHQAISVSVLCDWSICNSHIITHFFYKPLNIQCGYTLNTRVLSVWWGLSVILNLSTCFLFLARGSPSHITFNIPKSMKKYALKDRLCIQQLIFKKKSGQIQKNNYSMSDFKKICHAPTPFWFVSTFYPASIYKISISLNNHQKY